MARNRNKGFGTGISRPFWNRDHLGLYRKIPAYAGQKELIYGTLETLVVAFSLIFVAILAVSPDLFTPC